LVDCGLENLKPLNKMLVRFKESEYILSSPGEDPRPSSRSSSV